MNLAFDFGRHTTTLSEFIRYISLTDFLQISPNIVRIILNESMSGNIDIRNICPVASIYTTRLAYFFATPTLDADS